MCRGWDLTDTQVVCRQLAMESANSTKDEGDYYEGGNGTIWFQSVSCNSTESALEQCPNAGE